MVLHALHAGIGGKCIVCEKGKHSYVDMRAWKERVGILSCSYRYNTPAPPPLTSVAISKKMHGMHSARYLPAMAEMTGSCPTATISAVELSHSRATGTQKAQHTHSARWSTSPRAL